MPDDVRYSSGNKENISPNATIGRCKECGETNPFSSMFMLMCHSFTPIAICRQCIYWCFYCRIPMCHTCMWDTIYVSGLDCVKCGVMYSLDPIFGVREN